MKIQKYISKILDVFTALFLILFFASFGFQDGRSSGWYQQWFPNLNGSTITSMTFLDSLTGFAVTSTNSSINCYILKTTTGGDNWTIVYTYLPPSVNSGFKKIQFANMNIGYASTNYVNFFKTTNGGINWIDLPNVIMSSNDIAVINKDTILLVSSSGFDGGVSRTTNGGLNWQLIWGGGGSGMPSNIYMFDKNLGFTMSTSGMRRTSDGGFNWTLIPSEIYWSISFFDSSTGWKCYDSIKKTTDGGLSWKTQKLPNFISSFSAFGSEISVINKDTVWMVGAKYNQYRAMIFKTTNSGLNWGYQIPDTTLNINAYNNISFVNKLVGWASPPNKLFEIHTTIGGNDTTFFTSVNNNSSNIPENYILYQNYPNPFNSKSNIKYKISKSSNIKIKIFDITGKEIIELVNKKQNEGRYEVKFDGSNLSSGVYFYSLYADEVRVDTKKMLLLK